MEFSEKFEGLQFEESSKFPTESDIELDESIILSTEDVPQEEQNQENDILEQEEEVQEEQVELEENEEPELPEEQKEEVEIPEPEEALQEESDEAFDVFVTAVSDKMGLQFSDDIKKDINDLDSLVEAINQINQVNIGQYFEGYKQHLVQNLINDGLINPQQIQDNPLTYKPEDLKDDEEKAKNVLRMFYQEKGLKSKRVEAIVNSIVDVEKEALEALEDLNTIVAQRESDKEKQAKENLEKQEQAIRESISKNTEFVPGFKLDKKGEAEILEAIPNVLQKINSNLNEYAPILAILDKVGILDGDFEKIETKVKNKANKNFKELLAKNKGQGTVRTTGKGEQQQSEFNIDHSDVKRWYQ